MKNFLGEPALELPLEACAFGICLGNQSVFILDSRLDNNNNNTNNNDLLHYFHRKVEIHSGVSGSFLHVFYYRQARLFRHYNQKS